MTFDFGPVFEFVDITAQYSNAVLVAVLPYISDMTKRLELAPLNQFTSNAIGRTFIDPRKEDVAGSIVFTNGFVIGFSDGYIRGFWSPTAYSRENDPDRVPLYYAPARINEGEAIALARSAIKKLGISLEAVFADMEPRVPPLERVGTNTIPYYQVEWRDPRGIRTARVEVNANKKAVVRLDLSSVNLDRQPFKPSVRPRERPDHPVMGVSFPGINPQYGLKLFPIVLREVTNYASKLGIELPQPITTNHIRRFWVTDNDGWPHSELELTNGARFIYRNTNVCGYFAPDEFWDSDKRKFVLSDFRGSWSMSDREMIDLARKTVAKLGYPKDFVHTDVEPELVKPQEPFANIVPRCKVQWMYPNPKEMTQWAYVEVDADKRKIKSVYFDDESFRKNRPPIDVPIALKSN